MLAEVTHTEFKGFFEGITSANEVLIFKTLAKYRLGLTLMDIANKTNLPMFVVRRNLEELIKKGTVSHQQGVYRLPSTSKKLKVEEIKADLFAGMGEKLINRMLNDDACGIDIVSAMNNKLFSLETNTAVDYIFRLACIAAIFDINVNSIVLEALNSAAERIADAQIEIEAAAEI